MALGRLCKVCDTRTVHPVSTNWLQCSKCGTKYPKELFGL